MKKQNDMTAIILAGGKSSRMGSDKGLIDFHGKKMIEHLIHLLQPQFENIFIISNNIAYKDFGLKVYEDIYKNIGPIGGLHSGLTHSTTIQNLFVACDLPFLKKEIIEFIIEKKNDFDSVVPYHNHLPEPLCALYSKNCLPVFEKMITANKYKIQDSYELINFCRLNVPPHFFEDHNPFENINTKDDLIKK